ncbi:MAG: hypothetical protein RJA07_1505 [Bacteroidota bacterium]|jgi:hypothetical protein
MKLIEIKDKQTAKEFIEFPVSLYKGDDVYVRPWNHDVEDIFDENKNKFFRHGECTRWILKNDENITIGRIAAFINERTAKDSKTGGVGFFECINHQLAANTLFDTAKKWLQNKGMEAMEGPINFGDRDKWWGLLVDGFTHPTYGMNYNPTYYPALFTNYGFGTYYEQYVFRYDVDQPVPEKFGEKAERIGKEKAYRFEYLKKTEIDKYATYFHQIYNASWGGHHGFKPMALESAKKILKTIKPIMDPKLIWFGFYNETPISFFIMLPEINQAVKKLNGKFGWFEKLKFMYLLKFSNTVSKCYGVVFGVIPEFQARGVEGAIIKAAEAVIQKQNKYTDMEMNWIGSFNPKMIAICESLNAKKIKTLITYKVMFDKNVDMKPHPIIK